MQVIRQIIPTATRLEQLRKVMEVGNTAALKAIASGIADDSPVDTGTYVTSHAIYEGTSLSSIPHLYSSEGRPGGQDMNQMQGIGKAKMHAMVDNADHTTGNYIIGNEAEHREDVEAGYRVFNRAAISGNRVALEAALAAGLKRPEGRG